MSQTTPQFFIFKQSYRQLKNKKCNSSFTLQSKIHEFHQCPTAAGEVRLQCPKTATEGTIRQCQTSSEKLQSYILLHRPALELLHHSAPTHEISSSLFSSAWHFPRLYLLLYFPHTKDNWVLNIAPIRQRDVLNGLFSLPPAVHRLCMYLIHNMVNNWFFSACSTSKRNQKLFFFFFFFLFPRGKKKELFVLNFHFVCHLEWFSIWWVFITKEMEKSWSQDSQAPIAILQKSFFPEISLKCKTPFCSTKLSKLLALLRNITLLHHENICTYFKLLCTHLKNS